MIRIITDRLGMNNPEIQRDNDIEKAVDSIIRDVRERGDQALFDCAERFDGIRPSKLTVPEEKMEEACSRVDAAFLQALKGAARNIEAYHRRQIRQSFVVADQPGIVMGQRIIPLRRVGLYVPGGTAFYPSSVLMNAIPARIAGVGEIVLCTPPSRENAQGYPSDALLAAAYVAGVHTVCLSGGAQAIAAMAYGTETIPQVDKIVGPGNVYVATAKRRVFGQVDIDMIAGPSEILIVADKNSNVRHLAADLLSQAEHDRLASAVLITDSRELAEKVQAEIEAQLPLLPRADIARASIDSNGKIVLAGSLEDAVDIANEFAPEHLELMVDEPFALLGRIRNAGSVFLGRYAPEALGDYWAGVNHTLPTSGTARFSSPLSVDDFVKKSSYLYYTKDALRDAKDGIVALAEAEKLSAHARSVAVRFEEELS